MPFQDQLIKFFNSVIKAKGIWLRAGLSLIIGLCVLFISDISNYDLRYQLRGQQKFDTNILLVYLSATQFKQNNRQRVEALSFKNNDMNQSTLYWDKKFWVHFLKQLTSKKSEKIIINIKFKPDLLEKDFHPIFSHPKVHWVTDTNFAKKLKTQHRLNLSDNELIKDRDGVIRFFKNNLNNKHIINNVVSAYDSTIHLNINYRGPSGTFIKKTVNDNTKLSLDTVKSKVIIIGTEALGSQYVETPVGRMNSSEVMANVIDNYRNNRWVKNLSFTWSALYLIFILLMSIVILFSFPQSVALTYLVWLIAGLSALSLALFDNLNFWIPVIAPSILIASTYVLFLSYQLNEKENKNWKLQEEQNLQSKSQQLKNNFVSLISHDLKTPIAKIQGICDRIISSSPDLTYLSDIQIVRSETEQLNRYIQSILQITKVESKDFKIQKKPTDINKTLEKVLSHLKFMLIENQNKVELKLEPIYLIDADPVLIYEVFLNIIENSIKYAPKAKIDIKTYETENYVHIIIADDGPGIDEKDLKYIFDKFYRAKNQKNNAKGSGLGLYLVKYFIQLHNGSITINSKINAGTQLHLKLPLDNLG